MKYIYFTILFALGCLNGLQAQELKTKNGMTRFTQPEFSLSGDEKWLVIGQIDEQDRKYDLMLNLDDWTTKTTPLLINTRLLPDLKGSIDTYAGTYAGSGGWVSCTAYCSYYFPDLIKGVTMIQWPDRNYLFGPAPDGTFLAAEKTEFAYGFQNFPKFTGLKKIDPLTGKTIKMLRTDLLFDYANLAYNNPPLVLDKGNLLVWKLGGGAPNYLTVRTDKGPAAKFTLPLYINSYAKQLGIGTLNFSTTATKRMLVDMSTGKKLHDTAYNGLVCSAAAGNGNFYTLHLGSGVLTEEVFKGSNFLKLGEVKLEMAGVAFSGSQVYELMVSLPASRVMVLPKGWRRVGLEGNQMFAWDLKTGKLLYRVDNFYFPHDKFLGLVSNAVKQESNVGKAPDIFLQPNMVVKVYNTRYILVKLDREKKMWNAVKLTKIARGRFAREDVPLLESVIASGSVSGNVKVLSNQMCLKCGGKGSLYQENTRSTSSVDNYNALNPGGKVITTTTYTVNEHNICGGCKGAGYHFPNGDY